MDKKQTTRPKEMGPKPPVKKEMKQPEKHKRIEVKKKK